MVLAGNRGRVFIVKLITVLVAVTLVLRGRNPQTRLAIKGLVLSREVNTLTVATALVAAALGKGPGSLRELGRDRSVLGDPVGKSILAVLNNSIIY